MNLSRDIHPLTDFTRNTPEFIAQLEATGQPVVLTVNGKAELVVQDAVSYQRLLNVAARAEVMEGIRQVVKDWKAGRTEPDDEAFATIRLDLNLPSEP